MHEPKLVWPRTQVKQLAAPTLADIHQALADFQPNVLYIWAGCSGDPDPAVSPLQPLMLGGEDELLPEDLPELVAGLKLHALVLNLASEGIPVQEIQPYVPHIVRWKPGARRCFALALLDIRSALMCKDAARAALRWAQTPTYCQLALPQAGCGVQLGSHGTAREQAQ